MKIPRPPHNWQVSPRRAAAIQQELARAVRQEQPAGELRLVAGVDAAFVTDPPACLAGVVLWDSASGTVLESHTARRPLLFPYVPGLLSFREAPAIIAALRRLRRTPDALLVDGQGLAHPRRFGIACHLGLLTGLPSVGCAKSRLIGSFQMPGEKRGDYSLLVDRQDTIGAVLRTRDHVRPLFISIGHAIDLDHAIELTLACGCGYRLPEPTRLADRLVASERSKTRIRSTIRRPDPA
ncbi:deoxyribonuclease V [Desulfurivibrio alkaliphilus]|uniref:Endonuclease V n=1 Tax=Desulfurivibrio alkaliphilus (strain DSM 19089 / UNIQEM U267 / AHT2) TaxID=589865 RepID=D6Z412_DESAT|nr:deoxyribonuclease V [Desulfurivibrio alkaliphilus]ADH86287.1 Deoxyribonuclease V [Desulfurivibrio alkaliphilus AHT 2]